MPPKRAAASAPAATATKKAKAAPAAKPASKGKAAAKAAPAKSTVEAVVETVKKGAKKAAAEISAAVENAGELLVDDVAPEPEKKVAAKKGAKKAAAPAPAAEKPATRGTKRKTADDFMGKAEKVVATVTDKATEKKATKAKATEKAPATKKAAAAPVAKKSKKTAAPEPEVEEEAEGSEASFIGAFESDDEMNGGADSSDDESDAEDAAVAEAGRKIDMGKLPSAKDDKSVAARLKKASKKKGVQPGTIFLGRVPHGFYEQQMKEYFTQFGDVTRLRLARNPKTGASRHYAYVEFSSLPVAEIVADTMNNYLLMGHLLRCNVIPADEVHAELWVGANKKWRMVPRARLEKVRQDKTRTKEEQERANTNLLKRQETRRQKIKAAGIDYDFDGHA